MPRGGSLRVVVRDDAVGQVEPVDFRPKRLEPGLAGAADQRQFHRAVHEQLRHHQALRKGSRVPGDLPAIGPNRMGGRLPKLLAAIVKRETRQR